MNKDTQSSLTVGQIIVGIISSFRYYNELCFIDVKDSKGVVYNVLMGSSTTYNFASMLSLRKQAMKCKIKYNGRDDSNKYDKFTFMGFGLDE